MKKILYILASGIILAACGGEAKKDKEVKKAPSLNEKISVLEKKMTPEKPLAKAEGMLLINWYTSFADSLPKDEKSPEYLMKASDLYGFYGSKSEQCHLYLKIYETYPEWKDADMALYLYASALDSEFDKREEAKKYYQLYVEKYTNGPYINDAKARLETIDELSFKQLEEKLFSNPAQ